MRARRWPARALPLAAHLAEGAMPGAAEPAIAAAMLDPERQRQARRYARIRQRLLLADVGISAAVVIIALASGLNFTLADALAGLSWQPLRGWRPLQVAAYFLVAAAIVWLLGLPLSIYGGHLLPRRFGLSTQPWRGWLADLLKGLAIALPIEVAAVVFVFWLLAVAPSAWWLWTGLAMLIFTAVVSNLAPILLLPLFYRLTPLPDGAVRQRVLALAARAHTRVRGVYAMSMSAKTTTANAMVTGLGNTQRIVLGDTLLDRYTPDEIEVVVAHELGHQVHHDIPWLIGFQSAVTLGGLFVVNLALHAVVTSATRYHGLADPAVMPLLGAALGVFGLVTLPLTNGFSRRVEHRADVYALETTGKVAAFSSAMARLANQNLAELEPSPVIEFLLYNHPAIGRRLAYARRFVARET